MRRPASSLPIAQATGTSAIPASAEGRRSATAPVPSTRESRPRDQVPERRGVLGVDDRVQRRAEARVQDVDGREGLVVPEALQVERREAQRRRRAASAPPAATSGRARRRRPRRERRGPAAGRRRSPRAVASAPPARSSRSAWRVDVLRCAAAGTSRRAPGAARRGSAPRSAGRSACVPSAARGWCCRTPPRACWSRPSSCCVDREVVVVVAGVGAPGAQVGDQAVR